MKICGPYYRTHDVLQREGGSTESVIRACITAFPLIWVSSTDDHEVPLAEGRGLRLMSVCYFLIRIPWADFDYFPLVTITHSLRSLTWIFLYALQEVSVLDSVSFFPCPDKSLPLPCPASECPSLGRFLSVF